MHGIWLQVVNFSILAVLLFWKLKKPTLNMVKERSELIKKEVDEARKAKEEAELKYKEFNVKLMGLDKEASEIVAKAKIEAEVARNTIIETAQKTAERIIKDAEASSKMAFEDSRGEIKKEIIEKAIELAEKMIREKVSAADQKRILTEYVGKVER